MYAALYGRLDKVKTLFREGADVNAQNKYGVAALLTVIRSRHIKMEKLLLENGTDVTAKRKKSNSGWASTMCTSYYGDIKMTELLIENDGVYTISMRKITKERLLFFMQMNRDTLKLYRFLRTPLPRLITGQSWSVKMGIISLDQIESILRDQQLNKKHLCF